MKYWVTFYQTHVVEVEADDEEQAEEVALEDFLDYVRRPVARTDYDYVEVEPVVDSEE